MLRWFSGLPSQKWVWPSTTKISLPSGVTNMWLSARVGGRDPGAAGIAAPEPAMATWSDVFEDVVHVAEQEDGVVILPNHPPIVGRGVDLEGLGGHVAAEILADLV